MLRQTAVITGNGEVKIRQEALPSLKNNEVAIEVHASLISPGTEMSLARRLREKHDSAMEPLQFGYSCAGVVIEVRGDGHGLRPGMRVAAMGTGAFHADCVNVPVNLVVPIPDKVPYEEAVYACLGATSLQAIRRTGPALGEYGIVLGQGIVGNLAAQLAQLSGARIICWEGFFSRIKIARKCGLKNFADGQKPKGIETTKAFTAPYGADFAIMAFGGEATAAFDAVKSCMKVSADTHAMGRIVLVGGCQIKVGGGAYSGNLDIRAASRTGAGYKDTDYEHGQDYPAALVQFTTQRNLREIIALIAEKRLCVAPMTTHRIPLAEIGKAADLLIDHPDQAMGVVLTMKQ